MSQDEGIHFELMQRQTDALERIANILEIIAAGWGNANPEMDWHGKPWPRRAPHEAESDQ